jgi:TolC family type I secretion outer membrane protein
MLAPAAEAQEMPAGNTLSIPEAIELAWKNNIQSIRQENSLRTSEAQKVGTRATYLPSVSWSASWARSSPVQLAFINDELVQLKNSYRFQLQASQEIFNGFRYVHAPRAGAASVRASEYQLRSTRQQVALDTKRGCYDLIKAQMLADVQRRAVKRSEEQLETSKARYELGSASMSDFLKSKVQLGNDSLQLITDENAVLVARATLNDQLGLPVNRPTEVDAKLEFEPFPLPGTEAMAAAIETHPDVLNATALEEAARHDVGSARSAQYPTVSAFASYSYSTAFFPESFDEITKADNASFGLAFDMTLFSGFSTTSQIRQAKVRRHTAEAELVQARRTVSLAITTAALGVDEARKRYQVSEEQVRSAQEDLNIAQEKYNLGAATILDILNAQVSLSQAETGKVQAVFDYNLAVASLEKAMGGGD